jgi:hypothetical protein
MRRAATVVEVLLASGVALALLFGVWELFLAGRRGMVRGEAKLDYVADATGAFLWLQRDLHASCAEPEVLPGGVLVVHRWQVSAGTSALTTQSVTYAKSEGADQGDVALERRVRSGALPDEEREKRLCRRTLAAFDVAARAIAPVKGIEITLTFRGPQDAEAVRFRRVIVPRIAEKDETWIPVPR